MPCKSHFAPPSLFVISTDVATQSNTRKVHLAQQDILERHIYLGDATFLFYVNKSLGAEAAAYLSTLTINLSDERRLPAFI